MSFYFTYPWNFTRHLEHRYMVRLFSIASFVKAIDSDIVKATKVVNMRNFKCLPHIVHRSHIPLGQMWVPGEADEDIFNFGNVSLILQERNEKLCLLYGKINVIHLKIL